MYNTLIRIGISLKNLFEDLSILFFLMLCNVSVVSIPKWTMNCLSPITIKPLQSEASLQGFFVLMNFYSSDMCLQRGGNGAILYIINGVSSEVQMQIKPFANQMGIENRKSLLRSRLYTALDLWSLHLANISHTLDMFVKLFVILLYVITKIPICTHNI